MPRRGRDGRKRFRMGETLDALPPRPAPEGEGQEWRDLIGDRKAASRALSRAGWNKGERRGFGAASGRQEPPDPLPVQEPAV